MEQKTNSKSDINSMQHEKIIKLLHEAPIGSMRNLATKSKTSMTSVNRFIKGEPMRGITYDKIYDTIISIATEEKEKERMREDQMNDLLNNG
ncbi:MAG: hypothetical protein AB8B61_04505 [Cyclobacteriaceae bacterium]